MKCQVPQISWHSRDPVLSIDFQPNQTDVLRLASGGTDSHVLIWYITYQENKLVKIECASDLYRHNKSVNVVRFSPSGVSLASGDDEGAMFIWELKERELIMDLPNDDENTNKEDWYPVKLLRGHLEDIYDICWSKDGNFLVSSSMDNTAIIWDMQKYVKIHMLSDFKGYVQGVSWDPCNQYIASLGSDRSLRIHNINSKKVVYKISKAPWTNSTGKGTFKARLFYDDTLQSYFRRLTFTPDGELLIVPSGILEKGEKINNTCYIFSRHALNKPVVSLPTGDKYTVAVKCNPFLYKLRGVHDTSNKENKIAKPMINLPYRMIFAVAACDSVLLYDTEQLLPFAYVSNIHYTHLTDLSWSPDGLTLVVSSTDGYCSFILFAREELGEIYIPEKLKDTKNDCDQTMEVEKNEKSDLNQSSASGPESKDIITPNTPKTTQRISDKSPRVNSTTNEESVTPSSKIKLPADNKKSAKKSPKICSIKKFLVSPKTGPLTTVQNDKSKIQCSGNESSATKKIEVIEVSDSPIKTNVCSENVNISDIKDLKCETIKSEVQIIEKEEAMDVDEVHLKNICSDKLQASPNSTSGKQSKCKIRLNFADKDEVMAVIDDNASDSNPVPSSSAEDDVKSINESSIKGNENDWKLELSQDDDVLPMEVTMEPEIKPEVPDSFVLTNSSNDKELAASVPNDNGQKILCADPPKRRVAFVTLSSKTSFKK